MVCQALRGKGSAFLFCAEAIENELMNLLQRAPSLTELQFKDGTPFANSATRDWIQQFKQAVGVPNSEPLKSHAMTKTSLQEDWDQAAQLALAKQFASALALLQSGLDHGKFHERCERKLAIARLCSMHKYHHIAEPILSELCTTIKSQELEQWAPDFAVEVLRVRLQNLSALLRSGKTGHSDLPQRALHVQEWLARCSPSHAISFDLQP
jgi:type VI secretion system protein VasJ